jgi:glycerate-2-kinase
LRRIRSLAAAHPVPDAESLRGGRELSGLARRAGERDLVFALITGGSSALLAHPPEGVSLADKQRLNEVLLASGAAIREVNAVRKHVSQVKGGRLAQLIFPARLVNLTVSDVVGDPLDCITDPTVPDTSTYQDAWRTLDKYDLWAKLPASVQAHLRRGAEIETPKAFTQRRHDFIVVPGDAACRGAVQRCEELGFATRLLTAELEGESREAASRFIEWAGDLENEWPTGRARAVVAGGETTVTLDGLTSAAGGPNQEFALSAACAIEGREGVVVGAIDLDGTDGPMQACGGLVDGGTVGRARAAGRDTYASLRSHATRALLETTGDLVLTGPTGTYVNDLMFFLAHPNAP